MVEQGSLCDGGVSSRWTGLYPGPFTERQRRPDMQGRATSDPVGQTVPAIWFGRYHGA
jgi:hypothetical protein